MKQSTLLAIWIVSSGTLCSLSAEEWSRFRGPNGSGQAGQEVTLPAVWSNRESVIWKTPIQPGSSSPVVSGNSVFITGFSGYAVDPQDPGDRANLRLHVMCHDLETGREQWNYSFEASQAEQSATKRIADHGYASSTPCTDGQAVYASFGPSGVIALDMDGQRLWSRQLGDGTAGFGAASSPIEFQNLVIVNASIESDTLFALDKTTGEIVWQVDGIARAWTTPALVHLDDQRTELVIHYKNRILGIDPLSGSKLWSCEGIPDYIVPVPVVDGDRVYFSGGRQNRTIAVRAGGHGDVTATHKLWEVTSGANVTTPVLHDGNLYWSHDKAFALSLRASDGESNYQQRFSNRDRVYASVVYGDDKLFMTQRDGTTLVLEAKPEYSEIAANKLGSSNEQFNATPVIIGNSLLFRSTKFLYRIGN